MVDEFARYGQITLAGTYNLYEIFTPFDSESQGNCRLSGFQIEIYDKKISTNLVSVYMGLAVV